LAAKGLCDSEDELSDMKKSSYVRMRRSEAPKSAREHKKEVEKRTRRNMPHTPPLQEVAEGGITRSRITQLCWLEHELAAAHDRLDQALVPG
jgi:hypothetical protein